MTDMPAPERDDARGTSSTGSRRASWRSEPVHRPIRVRQLATAAVGLVVLVVAVVDLARGVVGPPGALAAFVSGAGVVALLVARLLRTWLLGHWATGALLAALGLWVTAGGLVGRVLGTRQAVLAALQGADARPRPRRRHRRRHTR